MLYEKNLTADFRLRISEEDFDFLKRLASERGTTVSAVVRSIVGDYRRSLDLLESLKAITEAQKGKVMSSGDTEANQHDII